MALITKSMSTTVIATMQLQCLNRPLFSLINLFNKPSHLDFNCSTRDVYDCDIEKKMISFEYDQLPCPLAHHPKYAADLPSDNIRMGFPTVPMVPSGIFRWTKQKVLGNNASKDAIYKNPEYFSYHQMSYYDMQLHMRKMMRPKKLVALKSLAIGVFMGPNDCDEPLCFISSCCGDDKKPPPLLGCDNPSDPTMYDTRKYGHQLPNDDVVPLFEVLRDIPSGVFRCTEGEILGLGAGKGCFYQNPEYFSFHHMSFFDFHLYLKNVRQSQPDSKRKPP
ncbi:unnamed protein product [Arctia plantaginis]|uniref:NADH dehydrogenase [ubiquinone] flavoprotein 3, mitochondrial n=1 Tax=Arctia plantaginis TaxID=874455 RepID=A0A8S1A5W1_ARCPL|nr:unnamed protein product [Arctia plantaginis]CAB3240531.1 unnamed protein product [Arctia plantaginis]